jgi:hypothetical protein
LQIKTKIVSSRTADSKPVKQEVNSTMILPPLVFPGLCLVSLCPRSQGNRKASADVAFVITFANVNSTLT